MSPAVRVGGFRFQSSTLPQDLARFLQSAGVAEWLPRSGTVFVKPNFTLPFPKPGVTTSPVVLEGLLGYLKDRVGRVLVGEADGGYASFTAEDSFRQHGLHEMARRTGAEVVNLSSEPRTTVSGTVGGRTYRVPLPRLLTQVDQSFSVPVLKTHVVVRVSLGLKNLWGCHPDTLRILDHDRLAEKLVVIARAIRLGPVLVDGIVGQDRRGPIEGTPVPVGVILGGNNPIATDALAARIMGFDPARVRHLAVAHKAGLGPLDVAREGHVGDDLRPFQQRFRLRRTLVDRLGALTFRSRLLTRFVFDSWASPGIYRILRRERKKKITAPQVGAPKGP